MDPQVADDELTPIPPDEELAPAGDVPDDNELTAMPADEELEPAPAAPLALVPAPPQRQSDEEKDALLREVFKDSIDKNPDTHSQVLKIANGFQLKAQVVEDNLPFYKRSWEAAHHDPAKWRKDNPDEAKAALEHPELGPVIVRDKTLNPVMKVLRGVEAGEDLELRATGLQMGVGLKSSGGFLDIGDSLAKEAKRPPSAPDEKLPGTSPSEIARDGLFPKQSVGMVTDPSAKGGVFDRALAAYSLGTKQKEYSLLGRELLGRMIGGGDTWELEKRAADLKQELTPRYYGEVGPLQQTLLDAAELAPSSVEAYKGAGIYGAAGALLGAIPGLVLRDKTLAKKGAGFGLKWGSRGGSALKTFDMESGGAILDMIDEKTDDGQPVNRATAAGMAVAYGVVASAIEAGTFGVEASAWGPLGDAIRHGSGKAFLKGMVKDAGAVALFKDIGKRWVEGAFGESFGEFSQQVAQELLTYASRSVTAGHLQKPDIRGGLERSTDAFTTSMSAGVALGPTQAVVSGATTLFGAKIAHEQDRRAASRASAISTLTESPTANASPEVVAKMVEDASKATGEPVTHVHVDPHAFVRVFQSQEADPAEAAAKLMGVDGPRLLQEAIATGGKLEVPVATYLERWGEGGLAKALDKDTTTQLGGSSLNQLAAQKEEIETRAKKLAEDFAKDNAAAPVGEELAYANQLEKQLVEKELQTPAEARKLVNVHRAMIRTMSEVFGKSPDELFRHFAVLAQRGDEQPTFIKKTAHTLLQERAEKLTNAERAHESFIDTNTGLLNERAFNEAPAPVDKPLVGHISIEGVKFINDNASHDKADLLYRAVGKALHAVDPAAAKVGGDFAVHVASEKKLDELLAQVARLVPVKGFELTGAVGPTFQQAGEAHGIVKAAAEKAGTRAKRGTRPKGFQGNPAELTFPAEKARAVVPAALAGRVSKEKLSAEDYFKERYRDASTGVWTAEGWAALPRKQHVVAFDVKGLKKVNDRYGQEWGDKLIHRFGSVAQGIGAEGLDFAHLHGDEYAAQHDSKEAAEAFVALLETAVEEYPVEYFDREEDKYIPIPVAFRHGLGEWTYEAADKDLNERKQTEKPGPADEWDFGDPEPGATENAVDVRRGERDGPVDVTGGSAEAHPGSTQEEGPTGGPPAGQVAAAPGSSITPLLREALRYILTLPEAQQPAAIEWYRYTQGITEERPKGEMDAKVERELAKFGVVDPQGYGYDEYGRTQERPIGGRKVRGVEPAELRRNRLEAAQFRAKGNMRGRYNQDPLSPTAPPWHSAVERAAANAKQKAGNAESWLSVLSKTPGVKKEELEVLGVPEWLKEQKGSISREQVLDYIKANRITVKETVLGAGHFTEAAKAKVESAYASGKKERENIAHWDSRAEQALQALNAFRAGDLSGAMSYAEAAITESTSVWGPLFDAIADAASDSDVQYKEYATKGHTPDSYRELLLYAPGAEGFKAGHFGEQGKGLTAHVRFSEHITKSVVENGVVKAPERVLLVDEVQSDLHQEGREKGYTSPEQSKAQARLSAAEKAFVDQAVKDHYSERGARDEALDFARNGKRLVEMDRQGMATPEFRKAARELRQAYVARQDTYDKETQTLLKLGEEARKADEATDLALDRAMRDDVREKAGLTREEAQVQLEKAQDARGKAMAARDKLQAQLAGQVPNAPFKESWEAMAMRRMVRWAAEHGYKKLAWTTGETQADRYSLAQHVHALKYYPRNNLLIAFDTERGKKEITLSPEELPGAVGKEVAEKLLAAPTAEDPFAPEVFLDKDHSDPTDKGVWSVEYHGPDGSELTRHKTEAEAHEAAAKLGPGPGHELSGLELKVGGEGMKTAYDKRITGIVRKLVEKTGGQVTQEKLGNGDTVWTATLPEALRSKALEEGMPLFAGDPENPRGYTDMAQAGLQRVFNIALNKNADLSTFLHETGHVFLEVFGDLAAREDAPERVKKDFATLLKWLEVEQRGDITREHHEKFARGFEAYFFEGKAPSPKLKAVFDRMRQWLKQIYKEIRALNVDLNDEVRGVFDRMLATDKEIEDAKAAMGVRVLSPSEAEAIGITGAAYQGYLEDAEQATSTAQRMLEHAVLKERLRETQSWWKEEAKAQKKLATDDYTQLPTTRAFQFLRNGDFVLTGLGGEEDVSKGPAPKLDPERVAYYLGREPGAGLTAVMKKGGMDPVAISDLFGFGNPRDFLLALEEHPEKDAWVAQRTQERMAELHPEVLADKEKMRELASKGLHGEHTGQWLLKEWEALKKKAQFDPEANRFFNGSGFDEKLPPLEAIQKAAKLIAEKAPVRRLDPSAALRAERSAADNATKAAARGNFQQALVYKQQQLLNFYVNKELNGARTLRDNFLELAGELSDNKARGKLFKANPIYRDGADLLLESLGLKEEEPNREKPLASLGEVVTQIEADSGTVMFDRDVLEKLVVKPRDYRTLSVAELREVDTALRNIKATARAVSTAILDGKRVEKVDLVDQLVVEARTSLPDLGPSVEKSARTVLERIGGTFSSLDGSWLRPETMLLWLGGESKEKSLWFRALMKPLLDGKVREVDLLNATAKPILEAFEAMPPEIQKRFDEPVDGAKLFPDHRADLKVISRRHQLLMMALNMGNQSNIDRLTEGRNITEEQVLNAINTVLTKEEMDWVQTVWNANESLRPEAFALEERDSGVAPPKIEPKPLVTKFGTYAGGYVPAIYNKDVEAVGQKQVLGGLAALMDPSYTRPSTAKSHLQSRVEEFRGAISLEPNSIPSHLAQVVHDIAFREALKSVGGLLLSKDVQGALRERLGTERRDQLLTWIKDVAQMRGLEGTQHAGTLMNLVRGVRGNTVISALGFAVPNMIEDLSNLVAVLPRTDLKAKHLAASVSSFLASPIESSRIAHEKSGELRTRREQLQRELQSKVNALSAKGPLQAKPLRWLRDHAFALMEASDWATSTPIWMGAYRQALMAGEQEADAVTKADLTVRQVFASHSPVDQAGILRDKGFIGASLMFYGFLNNQYNALRDISHELHTAEDNTEAAKRVPRVAGRAIGFLVATTVLSEFLRGRGREPDEEWQQWFLRKMLAGALSSVPFGGDAANAIEAKVLHKQANPRNNSLVYVGYSVADAAIRLATEKDDEKMAKRWIGLLRNLGPVIGLPTAQPARSAQYLYDVMTGKREVRGPGDFVSGIIYGEKDDQPATPFRPDAGQGSIAPLN